MIFNKQYTKWIPLGEYRFGDGQFLVMVRGSRKTGEIYFKTKMVNKKVFIGGNNPIGKLPLDVSHQWALLQDLMS